VPEVRETEEFSQWLRALRDSRARARIAARIRRLELGNPGDVKPIGAGVSEMRVNYGPGYRVYYCSRGNTIVIILCGGAKDRQADDIKRAIAMAAKLRE
jgi:putative addiction module killer protein